MATKRIEISKQRLIDKISERKKFLQKDTHDINELVKNNLEKKKTQFEKDIIGYEASTDENEEKISEYEETRIKAEDASDDLVHYVNVEEQKKLEAQQNLERQTEEKKAGTGNEEKKIEG